MTLENKKYTSPDQALTLLVTVEDGDISIGFDNFAWHTHGDVLAGENVLIGGVNQTPEEATQAFVDDVLSDKVLIAMSDTDGKKDAWATYNPQGDLKYKPENEMLTFRFWNGKKIYKDEEILSANVTWRTM